MLLKALEDARQERKPNRGTEGMKRAAASAAAFIVLLFLAFPLRQAAAQGSFYLSVSLSSVRIESGESRTISFSIYKTGDFNQTLGRREPTPSL